MAIYHLNVKTGSKAGGQSAAAKAAYIGRSDKYRKGRDEVALIHSGNMPEWVGAGRGRSAGLSIDYWKAADEGERSNGTLFREVEFALPHELTLDECKELAVSFADDLSKVEGGSLPYTLAIHDKPGNRHCHLVLSERINDGLSRTPELWFKRAAASPKGNKIDPAKGGAKKADIGKTRKDWLEKTREAWEAKANNALEQAGQKQRIDCRSLKDQGIERDASSHLGPTAKVIDKRIYRETKEHGLRFRQLQARRTMAVADRYILSNPHLIPRERPARCEVTPVVQLKISHAKLHQVITPPVVPMPERTSKAEAVLSAALDDLHAKRRMKRLPTVGRLAVPEITRTHTITPIDLNPPKLAGFSVATVRVPELPVTTIKTTRAEAALKAALELSKGREDRELIERRSRAFGVIERETKSAQQGLVSSQPQERNARPAEPNIRSQFAENQRRLGEVLASSNHAVPAKQGAFGTGYFTKRSSRIAEQMGGAGAYRSGHLLQGWERVRAAADQFVSAARARVEEITAIPPLAETWRAWFFSLVDRLGEPINGMAGRPAFPGTSGGTVLAVFEHPELNSVAMRLGGGWMLHNEVPGQLPAVGDYVEIKWTRDMDCLGAVVKPHPSQQITPRSKGMSLGR